MFEPSSFCVILCRWDDWKDLPGSDIDGEMVGPQQINSHFCEFLSRLCGRVVYFPISEKEDTHTQALDTGQHVCRMLCQSGSPNWWHDPFIVTRSGNTYCKHASADNRSVVEPHRFLWKYEQTTSQHLHVVFGTISWHTRFCRCLFAVYFWSFPQKMTSKKAFSSLHCWDSIPEAVFIPLATGECCEVPLPPLHLAAIRVPHVELQWRLTVLDPHPQFCAVDTLRIV